MDDSPIKITTVSTSDKGGGGIAAYRLHKSLNNSGQVTSVFLNNQSETNSSNKLVKSDSTIQESGVRKMLNTVAKKIGNRTPIKIESFENREIYYREKLNQLTLNCEIATLPYSQHAVENNEAIINADIVHLHWAGNFLNYPSFFKKVKQPIVWTLHDMNPFQGLFHYKNDEINNPSAKQLNEEILKKKRAFIHQHQNIHVVCLTDWMFQASKNSEALGRYPHYQIPNGLDFNAFNTSLSKRDLQTKYNINSTHKTLVFVSQNITNYRKGFDLLNQALQSIKNCSFNILTIGSNKIDLPTHFNHQHFEHIDDLIILNELYSVADLFVLPSREDNLPNVMLESFANGTPIMSYNLGGMKDWVIHNENGILVDELTPECFAKELINFAENKYAFNETIIKEYAVKNFNQINQTDMYIELYKSILK